MSTKVWVSVTGLELKSWLRYPQFMMYAVPSFAQAQSSPGNLYTGARDVGSIHHTLTVWESRADMLRYLRQGDHVKAMKITKTVAHYGKVYGYPSDAIPSWDEALQLWSEKGRVVLGEPREGDLPVVVSSEDSDSGTSKKTMSEETNNNSCPAEVAT